MKCPKCNSYFFKKTGICLTPKEVFEIEYKCHKCGFVETQTYKDKYEE